MNELQLSQVFGAARGAVKVGTPGLVTCGSGRPSQLTLE